MSKLTEQYPFLEDKDPNTYMMPDESWVDCLPLGWQDEFLNLCDKIETLLNKHNALPGFSLVQVKEKFGSARVYWGIDTNQEIYDELTLLVDAFEHESGKICSVCGKPATHRSKGWVLPYCYHCAVQDNNNANARHKTVFDFDTGYSLIN